MPTRSKGHVACDIQLQFVRAKNIRIESDIERVVALADEEAKRSRNAAEVARKEGDLHNWDKLNAVARAYEKVSSALFDITIPF